jgi:hypothetical protein
MQAERGEKWAELCAARVEEDGGRPAWGVGKGVPSSLVLLRASTPLLPRRRARIGVAKRRRGIVRMRTRSLRTGRRDGDDKGGGGHVGERADRVACILREIAMDVDGV